MFNWLRKLMNLPIVLKASRMVNGSAVYLNYPFPDGGSIGVINKDLAQYIIGLSILKENKKRSITFQLKRMGNFTGRVIDRRKNDNIIKGLFISRDSDGDGICFWEGLPFKGKNAYNEIAYEQWKGSKYLECHCKEYVEEILGYLPITKGQCFRVVILVKIKGV